MNGIVSAIVLTIYFALTPLYYLSVCPHCRAFSGDHDHASAVASTCTVAHSNVPEKAAAKGCCEKKQEEPCRCTSGKLENASVQLFHDRSRPVKTTLFASAVPAAHQTATVGFTIADKRPSIPVLKLSQTPVYITNLTLLC